MQITKTLGPTWHEVAFEFKLSNQMEKKKWNKSEVQIYEEIN